MQPNARNVPKKTILIVTIALIVLIIVIVGIFSWVLTRGVRDDQTNVPTTNQQSTQSVPKEPSNPNVTGGSSGTGSGTSNDPAVQTPSPAGGVDTNQTPSGSYSN